MRVLYLEDNEEFTKFIHQLDDCDSYAAPINIQFDHLLLPITSFQSLLKNSTPKLNTLTLDQDINTISIDGKTLELSKKEYDLLHFLMSYYPKYASREKLRLVIWRDYDNIRANVVEVYISRLRRKLGKSKITCVKGFGYRLNVH
jgi:DNA-binding response OmpR family regulator